MHKVYCQTEEIINRQEYGEDALYIPHITNLIWASFPYYSAQLKIG